MRCAWDFNTVSSNVLSIRSYIFAGTAALNSVSGQTGTWNVIDEENSEACLHEYRGASCSKFPVTDTWNAFMKTWTSSEGVVVSCHFELRIITLSLNGVFVYDDTFLLNWAASQCLRPFHYLNHWTFKCVIVLPVACQSNCQSRKTCSGLLIQSDGVEAAFYCPLPLEHCCRNAMGNLFWVMTWDRLCSILLLFSSMVMRSVSRCVNASSSFTA